MATAQLGDEADNSALIRWYAGYNFHHSNDSQLFIDATIIALATQMERWLMAITPAQTAAAAAVQQAAAQDTNSRVRLVAGPGTGKSASIEERVCWLIRQGVPATEIFAISFTRASAHDLRLRIHQYASQTGYHT